MPEYRKFATAAEESLALAGWLAALARDGIAPDEIAVLVRSEREVPRARSALDAAGLAHAGLADAANRHPGRATLATMHQAKGTEFRAVAVMACDAEILPSEARLTQAQDEAALDEIFARERHLLYVAATRARERLWVSGAGRVSEFLEDLVRD